MKRGDIVLVATRGACTSKPRPALAVQSDLFNPTHASVTLALVTSTLRNAPLFRVAVTPTPRNEDAVMERVDEALKVWLQL